MVGRVTRPQHLVVMGVAGVGKTTIALRLRDRLDLEYAEGDDFHPAANVAKMTAGEPLTDADRSPWLEALAAWIDQRHAEGRSTVTTCSALRRRYRDILRSGGADPYFVHLHGPEELIRRRMERREHFMPPALLRSQFDTLEPLESDEAGMTVDVTLPVDEIVTRVVAAVAS
jgi:gluconokinase